MIERRELFYRIVPKNNSVDFYKVDEAEFYSEHEQGSFIRKVGVDSVPNTSPYAPGRKFVDQYLQLTKSKDYFLARISDLYDFDEGGDHSLFSEEETSSIINKSEAYCSFLCESGLLNYNYLRTLFITQKVNREGRYQYFIKRDGQYTIEECDDIIPVDRRTWKPLWGLSYKHPWQLVLLKAWIKECGGWLDMLRAEPFKLLDAFGLPEYKVFNFRKDIRFLKNERVPMEQRSEKIRYSKLNDENIAMIAATASSKSSRSQEDDPISKVGLIPNKAGYRIFPFEIENRDNSNSGSSFKQYFYKVETKLPVSWVGKLTAASKTQMNDKYDNSFSLGNTIIMTEDELLQCFNKFYAVPEQLTFTKSFTTQDSIDAFSDGISPIWVSFQVSGRENEQAGLCGISIQLPENFKFGRQKNYPDIRYFLAKQNTETQMKKSHFRSDVRGSERDGNLYTSSTCDKWEEFSIDYIQGYHPSASTFPKIVPGNYILYIHTTQQIHVRIRFDSEVRIARRPEIVDLDLRKSKEIFDSVFFSIGSSQGVETSFTKESFKESINLNDTFEELGFASVCIKTLQIATNNIAMRVNIKQLERHRIRVLPEYNYLIKDNERGEPCITLMSEKGKPEIIVMEKIDKRRENMLGTKFPPEDTFEFFKVFPLPPGAQR